MKMFNKVMSVVLGMLLAVPAVNAQKATPESYMRSSLYTVLLVSKDQNAKLDKEAVTEGAGASLIKSFSKGQKEESEMSPSEAPQNAFFTIEMPDQFNDHNLYYRLIDFDSYSQNVTDDDKNAVQAKKKKGGFGKMLGNVAKSSVGISTDNPNSVVDELGAATVYRWLTKEHYPDSLVAKWFDYNKTADVWDLDLIIERGLQDVSPEERAQAQAAGLERSLIQSRGMELINNTYVIAINLRFRSNQAIVAEAEAVTGGLATSLLGSAGSLATTALSAGAAAAAGEGFQVQAKVYLFKLVWDQNAENRFGEEIFAKKASLDDLINSGICKVEYVGTEKAGARVRQSLTNKTAQDVLIARATTRAIDNAIAKLQEKYEVFRTAFPIARVADGKVYAKVGMKEGITKGDEYEILEMQEDPKTGKTIYKPVGKVKAIDKQIWDNRAGAAEDVAEEIAEAAEKNEDVKAAQDYVALGETAFEGAKKGQDYTGYYLRLKKKK